MTRTVMTPAGRLAVGTLLLVAVPALAAGTMTALQARAYLSDQGIDILPENLPQQILIGNAEAVDALIAAGIDVKAKTSLPQSPLELAAMSCSGGRMPAPVTLHMIDSLIAAGADPDAPGIQGLGPLMIASQQCQAPVVSRLVAAGAKLDSRTPQGFTPLTVALTFKNYGAAGALIDKGARITAADGRKLTEGSTDQRLKALVARAKAS